MDSERNVGEMSTSGVRWRVSPVRGMHGVRKEAAVNAVCSFDQQGRLLITILGWGVTPSHTGVQCWIGEKCVSS